MHDTHADYIYETILYVNNFMFPFTMSTENGLYFRIHLLSFLLDVCPQPMTRMIPLASDSIVGLTD